MSNLVSSDAIVAHLEGEAVVLHAGTKDYFRLNATAQRVWRLLEEGRAPSDIARALTQEFEVTEPVAAAEVETLLANLRRYQLVEVA